MQHGFGDLHVYPNCVLLDLHVWRGGAAAGEPKDYRYTEGLILEGPGLFQQGRKRHTGPDASCTIVVIIASSMAPVHSQDM